MKCPFCEYTESKVIDSRPVDEGASIRRRRECLKCEKRFTTYEQVESVPLIVIRSQIIVVILLLNTSSNVLASTAIGMVSCP